MNVGKPRGRRASQVIAALGLLVLAGCGGDSAAPARSTAAVQLDAPADLVAVGQMRDPAGLPELGLEVDPLPADAVLIGSHYAIALAAVAVADELSYEQLRGINLHHRFPEAEAGPLRAGPGREFMVVPLTAPESAGNVLGGDSAEVIVDGESRPLDRVPHELEVLVVNVPAGGDAVLAITDAGETKTISLRTGGRENAQAGTDEDHPADALQGAAAQLEEGVAIAGVSPAGQADGLRVNVSLSPYGHLDDRGWADEGNMWLEIEFQLTLAGLVAERAVLRLDLAQSLTITGSDGTGFPVPADSPIEPALLADGALATAEWSGAVQVPDTLRSFEVSYTTHGTFTSPDGQELSFTRLELTPTATVELTER